MKAEDERINYWTICQTQKKFKLWEALDFEKVFEDENEFRGKFNERLESLWISLLKLAKVKVISRKRRCKKRSRNSKLSIQINLQIKCQSNTDKDKIWRN